MELAGLFLLILMPPADATGETAAAITSALHAELGDISMIVAPDTLVTPAMWKNPNASMHARFVAHVAWKGTDKAAVDVVATGEAEQSAKFHETRTLTFAPQDSSSERGRAIALVVAELLRESPAVVLMAAHPPVAQAAPAHVSMAGLFAIDRVGSGKWAEGPEVRVGFGLREALWGYAEARVFFASSNQYMGYGASAGALWRFLRSGRDRHYLGIGLGVDVSHESASLPAVERGPALSATAWDVALVPRLTAGVTLWRHLRFVCSADARLQSNALSKDQYVPGDDGRPGSTRSLTYSKVRPSFALGIELAL